ncbi:ABC transporter permease [Brevibacillus migulae]|uniref:ABC transporter permease n=1 Tax=Brevibacillus migulae TaxID=1644114 RepID=UPI00106E3234|nr:ABC transporter permease [Brevibacillus migulae]
MKTDLDALFEDRYARFSREFIRYSQYMANGGMLFIAIFLGGLIALYYRDLIAAIPPWFPVPYALAFVVSLLVTRTPHRTFLLEADLLFLTPLEHRMEAYFRKTRRYNWMVQSIFLFLLLLLFFPVYQANMQSDSVQLWFYWLVPIILKGWNVHSSWILLKLPEQRSLTSYALARYLFSFLILAWVFTAGEFLRIGGWSLAGLFGTVFLIGFSIQLNRIRKQYPYQWYRLLEIENRQRRKFYRFVNQFTDIPQVGSRGQSRRWLSPFVRVVPYAQANAGRILFLRMFLRSADYLGIYVRLLVIGGLLAVLFPDLTAKAAVIVMILLMTASQIKGIWKRQRKGNGRILFPINVEGQKRSFQWVCGVLLLIQGLLISIMAWLSGAGSAVFLLFLVSFLASYGYSYLVLPRGLRA